MSRRDLKRNAKIFHRTLEAVNVLKEQGVTTTRGELIRMGKRFRKENESILAEAENEQNVLRMKRHYVRKGWTFPPTHHHQVTTCHMINRYYGKEVCKHIPKDKLEKKVFGKSSSLTTTGRQAGGSVGTGND